MIVNSINKQNPSLNWDAYQALSIVFIAYSIGNLIVPSVQKLISTEQCLFIPSIVQAFCFLTFLYPIKYALTIQSIILGFCTSLLWTSQCTYLAENSTPQTIDRNTGLLWSIYQFGLILGSFYFYFQYQGVEVIKDTDRVHTYCFFITILFVGAFLFLLLKKNQVDTQIKDQPILKKCFSIMRRKEMLIFSIGASFIGKLIFFFLFLN